MGDALEVSGRLRYHSPSPLTEGGWGDGEFPLFGEKNPLHPALLHEGGGESGKPSRIEGGGENRMLLDEGGGQARMLFQRKPHSAIALGEV
jgi:hypothetical protein